MARPARRPLGWHSSFAEVNVTGGRQHVQMETFAFGVRLSLDGIVKVVKDLDGDAVCIFVIVTEERGTVQYELSHGFLSFEVGIGSMDDLLHIEFTFFEYMFFRTERLSVIVPKPVH